MVVRCTVARVVGDVYVFAHATSSQPRNAMRLLLLLATLWLLPSQVFAQFQESFETAPGTSYTLTTAFDDGGFCRDVLTAAGADDATADAATRAMLHASRMGDRQPRRAPAGPLRHRDDRRSG